MKNNSSQERRKIMLREDLFFKVRTVKVNPETPIITVQAILNQAGVLLKGRYEIDLTGVGTTIRFLATDLQWYIVKYSLDHIDEITKGVDELFKR
jgi:hypothetical protein